ncbi:site-specific integrase [Hymenobacter sp. B81]|uniref:site-specific integrase n=1 Tax=Hymenobacter sp. B81 TaxID=3344878 RepID=UPI0037DCCEE9
MLRTKYYLTDSKAPETAIYAACYLQGQRKKIYTPLTVAPTQWDPKGQKFRRNFPDHPEANALLKKLTEELDTAYMRLTAKGQMVAPDDLRQVVARVLNGPQQNQAAGVLEYMAEWIKASERDRAKNTIKGYLTLQKHVADYVKLRRMRLEFATMDKTFCEAFKTYLLKTAGLSNTSINNHVKNLKVFLGSTFEQGLHEYTHFKKFTKLEALEPDVVYLTEGEKHAIAALNLDYLPRLERTRDVFLFECETGLRFSDVKDLRPEQVQDDHLLVTTLKTADLLRVPLSPLAQSIIAKYLGHSEARALPVKSNQKTNIDLKQIARLAKINTPTATTHLRGKVRQTTKSPKWELVSTHTARRTFITLALEGGMRPETVMRITGHKDYKMLHRYVKITDAVVQDEFEEYVQRRSAPALRVAV